MAKFRPAGIYNNIVKEVNENDTVCMTHSCLEIHSGCLYLNDTSLFSNYPAHFDNQVNVQSMHAGNLSVDNLTCLNNHLNVCNGITLCNGEFITCTSNASIGGDVCIHGNLNVDPTKTITGNEINACCFYSSTDRLHIHNNTCYFELNTNGDYANIYTYCGCLTGMIFEISDYMVFRYCASPNFTDDKRVVNVEGLKSYVNSCITNRLQNAYLCDSEISSDRLWSSQAITNCINNAINGLNWQQDVIDFTNDVVNAPSGGNGRYIYTSDNNIYEYDGSSWTKVHDTVQHDTTWVTDLQKNYTFNGTEWVLIGTTISHSNLQDLQGGDNSTYEFYHLNNNEYNLLRSGSQDATCLHIHDSRYYTKTNIDVQNAQFVKHDGSVAMTGNLNINNNNIICVNEIDFVNSNIISSSTFDTTGKVKATETVFTSTSSLTSTNIANALDELDNKKIDIPSTYNECHLGIFNNSGHIIDSGFYVDDTSAANSNVLWSSNKIQDIVNGLNTCDNNLQTQITSNSNNMFKHDGSVGATGTFCMCGHNIDMCGGCILNVGTNSIHFTDGKKISSTSFDNNGNVCLALASCNAMTLNGKTDTDFRLSCSIQYGTELPPSANEGDIFLVIS